MAVRTLSASVTDATIVDRINGYMQQDRDAGRRFRVADYITIADVREQLDVGICARCRRYMGPKSHWVMHRPIDELAHVRGNVVLEHEGCNKREPRGEQRMSHRR